MRTNTRVVCHCRDCGAAFWASTKEALYCPVHRPIRRRMNGGRKGKYLWTPERDAYLREHYPKKEHRKSYRIAAALGLPRWVVTKRAQQLALTYPHDRRDWTPDEVRFLEEHSGYRTPIWMAKKLKRSLTAVTVKLKRLALTTKVKTGYTQRELELCFGVDHRVIERWVREGKLKITKLPSQREKPVWHVSDRQVQRFIREHPMAFRLDRVDQLWFMDLMASMWNGGARGWAPGKCSKADTGMGDAIEDGYEHEGIGERREAS